MEKVLSVLKNTKILGIVGALLLIVGSFMNFATADFFGMKASISLIGDELECPWVLILGIIALAIVFIDFIISKIPEGKVVDYLKYLKNQKFAAVPAVISAIIVLVEANGDAAIFDSSYVNAGLGFYVLLIGAIALAAYPFLYKGE